LLSVLLLLLGQILHSRVAIGPSCPGQIIISYL